MRKFISFFVIILLITAAIFTLTYAANEQTFTDVSKDSWFYNPVEYCYRNKLVKGMTETTFEPDTTMSRAMIVTIFAAIEGIDTTSYKTSSFSDVSVESWYAPYIQWAYQNNIISGYGDTFGPNDPVTREQIAVITRKFADFKDIAFDTYSDGVLEKFTDKEKIDNWATDALAWAVASGMFAGNNDGSLAPLNSAERSEVSTIIYRFHSTNHLDKEFATSFTVSKAFSSDMVLQRDKKLSVWGWADEDQNGKIVVAKFNGLIGYAEIQNGEWKITFDDTLPVNKNGSTLALYGDGIKYLFNDVLVGDVYYVIGQSNVYWSMDNLITDLTNVKKLSTLTYDYNNSRNIRLFRNSSVDYINETGENAQGTAKLYKDVLKADAEWKKPSEGAPDFSAIGYLFAYNLSNEVEVPIGMIEIDASGCPLSVFTPNELADKWGVDILNTETGIYYATIGFPHFKTRFAYNQQLYPLINFSTAGILWYQGESDAYNTIDTYGKDAYTFSNEFTELMTYYRNHMGNDDFPVFIMEFPACFDNAPGAQYIPTGVVRSELGTIPMSLENSYVISSSDLWDEYYYVNNIHPYCKPGQALRASDIALSVNYGINDVNYTAGPHLADIEYTSDSSAVLTFNHVGDGIMAMSEDESGIIYGIEVKTVSGWIRFDGAEIISKNQIVINYNEPIYGVRYNAQTNYFYPGHVNLCNSAGVPAVAFADYR